MAQVHPKGHGQVLRTCPRNRSLILHFYPNRHKKSTAGAFSCLWRRWESNPHEVLASQDFESCASTNSATAPFVPGEYTSLRYSKQSWECYSVGMDQVIEQLRPYVESLVAVDSIWSVLLRGGIWLAIAIIIIISTDAVNPDMSRRKLRSNLGFFLLFLVLSGGLMYLLFGYSITST